MALYKVTDSEAPEGTKPRLVSAPNQAAAIRHVTGTRFSASAIHNPLDVVDLMNTGHTVEHAKADAVGTTEEPAADPKSGETAPQPEPDKGPAAGDKLAK